MNLIQWLDDLVIVNAKGDHSLVVGMNGVKQDGLYNKLRGVEHSIIEAKLRSLSQLHTECFENNISAGKYFAIEIAGRGQITFVNKTFGPFL